MVKINKKYQYSIRCGSKRAKIYKDVERSDFTVLVSQTVVNNVAERIKKARGNSYDSTVHITIPEGVKEQSSPQDIREFLCLLIRGIAKELRENELGKTTLEGVNIPLTALVKEGDFIDKIMHKIGWVYNIYHPDGSATRFIRGESFILKDQHDITAAQYVEKRLEAVVNPKAVGGAPQRVNIVLPMECGNKDIDYTPLIILIDGAHGFHKTWRNVTVYINGVLIDLKDRQPLQLLVHQIEDNANILNNTEKENTEMINTIKYTIEAGFDGKNKVTFPVDENNNNTLYTNAYNHIRQFAMQFKGELIRVNIDNESLEKYTKYELTLSLGSLYNAIKKYQFVTDNDDLYLEDIHITENTEQKVVESAFLNRYKQLVNARYGKHIFDYEPKFSGSIADLFPNPDAGYISPYEDDKTVGLVVESKASKIPELITLSYNGIYWKKQEEINKLVDKLTSTLCRDWGSRLFIDVASISEKDLNAKEYQNVLDVTLAGIKKFLSMYYDINIYFSTMLIKEDTTLPQLQRHVTYSKGLTYSIKNSHFGSRNTKTVLRSRLYSPDFINELVNQIYNSSHIITPANVELRVEYDSISGSSIDYVPNLIEAMEKAAEIYKNKIPYAEVTITSDISSEPSKEENISHGLKYLNKLYSEYCHKDVENTIEFGNKVAEYFKTLEKDEKD